MQRMTKDKRKETDLMEDTIRVLDLLALAQRTKVDAINVIAI
jgi:hypothetical protein